MEEVSGRNLESFFHQWLYVAGQPDLKTEWAYNAATGKAEVTVTQTQEVLFKFPLELEITGEKGTERIKTEVNQRVTKLTGNSSGKPISVLTDPEVVLLFREIK